MFSGVRNSFNTRLIHWRVCPIQGWHRLMERTLNQNLGIYQFYAIFIYVIFTCLRRTSHFKIVEGILRRDSNRTFRFGLSFLTPRLVVKKWGWCVSERAFIQFPFTFGTVRIATGGALYCSVASSYRSAPERSTSKFLRSDPCRCGYHVLLNGRYGRTHTAVTF